MVSTAIYRAAMAGKLRFRRELLLALRQCRTPQRRPLTEVNGCFWCGTGEREHAQRHHALAGWHAWTTPTDGQRKNRLIAHIVERRRAS